MSAVKFPKGFSWGVSTSSYQIEGAAFEDGRGTSIWDTYCHEPQRVFHGDTGDVACDHYHRLEADLDLIAGLGVDVYRFSIAWPRIQPLGTGPANLQGLEFYARVIDGLHARGVRPVPTLYHWDLPQALQDRGGWANREIIECFASYTQILIDAFGDRVPMWTTINEPWVAAHLGYGIGIHAPGIADESQAAAAHHHLLLAHAAALEVIRRTRPDSKVGIALNLMHIYSGSDHADDRAAADLADCQLNRSMLDPLFKGRYPDQLGSLSAHWHANAGLVQVHDLQRIQAKLDFLSINSYHPRYVVAPGRVDIARQNGFAGGYESPFTFGLPFVDVHPGQAAKTDAGWLIEPQGFHDLIVRLGRDCPHVPLYVSENGAAYADYAGPDGAVIDSERVGYLDGHFRAAQAAIETGVDLRGYWVWSLMDNFEWSFGFSKRFGLVYVDYATQVRTPKSSYEWFRGVVRNGSLPDLTGVFPNLAMSAPKFP
ncbi:MAG TPA: GH1 family beta-glucosidase [Steroidobacteraceae bacterium]|nr:GH1 family beta-glucosidase [Steroidobacteraceae bacterium]